jgi:hypothetical protein
VFLSFFSTSLTLVIVFLEAGAKVQLLFNLASVFESFLENYYFRFSF